MTPADIDRLSRLAFEAGITASGDMAAALERFRALVIEDFLVRSGKYLTNDASREACIAEAVADEREARTTAQLQNEELKARIARVGLEGNLAKAKAVRDEREACVQIVQRRTGIPEDALRRGTGVRDQLVVAGEQIIDAIRARGTL
jgi:hypothetical protein